MKLENLDDQLMVLAAHRYCLGRQSYPVGSCLNWLRETWDQFEANTKFVVLRDTYEGLHHGNAGDAHLDVPAASGGSSRPDRAGLGTWTT